MNTRTITHLAYRETPEATLFLDAVFPETTPTTAMPAVIYVHGGGWQSGDKSPLVNRFLAEAGYFTVSIQYRFSQEALFPAQAHDVKSAVRWLRTNAERFHIDTERIGIWGHSAGGHLAALVGTSGGLPEFSDPAERESDLSDFVHAVVGVAPVITLFDDRPRPADSPSGRLLGDAPRDIPERAHAFSPITHLREDAPLPAFLLLHGKADKVVPISHSELFYDRLRAMRADATLIPIADGNHMLRDQWAIVEHLTRTFFDRVLKAKETQVNRKI